MDRLAEALRFARHQSRNAAARARTISLPATQSTPPNESWTMARSIRPDARPRGCARDSASSIARRSRRLADTRQVCRLGMAVGARMCRSRGGLAASGTSLTAMAQSRQGCPGARRQQRHEPAEAQLRVYAFVIDWFLIGGLCSVFLGLVFAAAGTSHPYRAGVNNSYWLFSAYEIATVALWGRRLGDRIVGILVVTAGSDEPPGWVQLLVRWVLLGAVPLALLVTLVPSVRSVTGVLGLFWTVVLVGSTLSDADGRGFHDRAAKTAVVKPVR